MLLSAVSVLVVAQSSSEIPEGLMNNPVFLYLGYATCRSLCIALCIAASFPEIFLLYSVCVERQFVELWQGRLLCIVFG